jgi:hypothetical protein
MKVTKTADGAKIIIVLEQAETDKLLYTCEDVGEVYHDAESLSGVDEDEDDETAYVASVGMMLCELGDHIRRLQHG